MIASRTAALAAAKLRALGGAALIATATDVRDVAPAANAASSREARLEAMRLAAAEADALRAAKATAAAALGATEAALNQERLRRTGGGGGEVFMAATAAAMVTGGGQRVLDGIRAAHSAKLGGPGRGGGDDRLL